MVCTKDWLRSVLVLGPDVSFAFLIKEATVALHMVPKSRVGRHARVRVKLISFFSREERVEPLKALGEGASTSIEKLLEGSAAATNLCASMLRDV